MPHPSHRCSAPVTPRKTECARLVIDGKIPCLVIDGKIPCLVIDGKIPCLVIDGKIPCLVIDGKIPVKKLYQGK